MGYDHTAFSAAVINLAVKGYLTIDNSDDDYVLTRTESRERLEPGERALLARLFRRHRSIELDNKNHATISAAQSAHKQALRRDYLNTYFTKNTPLLLPSLAVSAVLFVNVLGLDALIDLLFEKEICPFQLGNGLGE